MPVNHIEHEMFPHERHIVYVLVLILWKYMTMLYDCMVPSVPVLLETPGG